MTYGARNLRRTIQKDTGGPHRRHASSTATTTRITQIKAVCEDDAVKLYTL